MRTWICGLLVIMIPLISLSDEISITMENDVLHSTDKYYTHGTKIHYDIDDKYGIILGQNIYTPLHKDLSDPLYDERPYAGWLYLGCSITLRTNNICNYYEFTAGIVGPHSYSEEVQKEFHRLIHNSIPEGWQNQLHDEAVANVYFKKTICYNIVGDTVDILPYLEASAGSVYTAPGVGTDIRIGYNLLQEFRPEINIKNFQRNNFSFYVFSGVNGRWVMHNMFLDGNNYRSEENIVTVDKEPLVGEWRNGVAISYNSFELRFTEFYRSKEFTTQDKETWNSSVTIVVRF